MRRELHSQFHSRITFLYMSFLLQLENAQKKNNSLLCVGLDPDIIKIPNGEKWVLSFLKNIIDQTADIVCAFKPQIAYFSSYWGEQDLEDIITYIHDKYPDIPVILDAKRGDIGPTAEQYAKEVFERYCADAVTVNPYMWWDTIEPFLRYRDRSVMVLCKTSNPWSGDFQDLKLENGHTLYEEVAHQAKAVWSQSGTVGLVVWATHPDQAKKIREIVGDNIIFLVPWIGAQWADIQTTVESTKNSYWTGIIMNSSRAILYPKDGQTPRQVAIATRDEINTYR